MGWGSVSRFKKFGYLPEVQGDTIFAAAAEELGFIRILLLVGAFLFIAYKGYFIASRVSSRFHMLVAVGITSWFTFQAVINMMVNLSLFPLTGITLPFVSYGGSSLIANMIAAGILLNISRYVEGKAPKANLPSRRRFRGSYHPQPRYR
ncbi:FtsW/RodA/SpoVE family cell cycle protein [Candidatus Peregrinibacteria bacterium]|nr:MAG: FtsW/RodA/SpoVE family cell cycle protein [Candidatus Peregrinibacteria bacterium]